MDVKIFFSIECNNMHLKKNFNYNIEYFKICKIAFSHFLSLSFH